MGGTGDDDVHRGRLPERNVGAARVRVTMLSFTGARLLRPGNAVRNEKTVDARPQAAWRDLVTACQPLLPGSRVAVISPTHARRNGRTRCSRTFTAVTDNPVRVAIAP